MKKHIANGFTLLNLLFGCIAILYILHPLKTADAAGDQWQHLSQQLSYASGFILLSAIVDFFDGFVARLLNSASEMGKQLDSLADTVSFGVAPSLIVFRYLELILSADFAPYTAFLYSIPAFLIACAGAYRLARFNISTASSVNFQGVPIPAAGMLTASFPFIFISGKTGLLAGVFSSQWFWYGYIVLISYLMVSSLPMMSLKSKSISVKKDFWKILLAVVAVVAAFLFQWLAVPIVFMSYVILSAVMLPREQH